MKYNKSLITYAIFGTFLMVFGFISSTMRYADAVTTVNVTAFPSGTITRGVAYRTDTSVSDTTAYIIGHTGAQAFVWKKSGTLNTIIANVTLTGSTVGNTIVYNKDNQFVYVTTENKIFKLTTNIGIAGQLAVGGVSTVRKLIYDDTHNLLYFCTNDSYGTINQVTLATTGLYTDPQVNGMLDCSIDEANNIMYISGQDIGASFTCEALKISLNTHTQVDCASFAGVDSLLFGVCYDKGDNKVWYSSSSGSKVKKLDADLNLVIDVATGTIPRNCDISTDTGARRLYQVIEGTDSVSIIDIDSNVIQNTQLVCDVGASQNLHIDTKRLFNTTNTYIPCPVSSTTNRVIIDDTVSEEVPPNIINGVNCDLPQNFGILTCDTTTGSLTGASELFNQSATNLICQVALIPCTDFVPDNPDIKTNGVGYLLTAVAIAIFVSLLWVGSRGQLTEIPTFIWFIGIIAVLGAITAIGWIDPTFFIIGIIVISALATAKVKGVLGDNSLFKGEGL